jgi:two-component system response regulator AtoC
VSSRRDEEATLATIDAGGRGPVLSAVWDSGSLTMPLPERGRAVLGRGIQSDVVIDHPSMSRAHAALELDGSGLVWEDLGSSNGTRVRGRLLAPHERVSVGWGEPVELGGVVVMVRTPDTAEPASELQATEDLEMWIERVAPTDMSVLLLGETGVGKGYYARSIHDRSHRAAGPFMHINCAALPDQLLESELFGFERGAFTGAAAAKPGLLEAATGGSVFLDEIGELSAATQAKLLVALERREVMRVGAVKPRPFDVRFLAATNKDLQALAEQGRFRADLFFRIAGLPLVVPPLRERRPEIAGLARTFVARSAERLRKPAPALSMEALEMLEVYPWPGNVRELMTAIDRAVLLAERAIGREHVSASLRPAGPRTPMGAHGAAPPSSPGGWPPPSQPGLGPATPAPPPSSGGFAAQGPLPSDEAERIRAALDRCAGNQSRAAELLGISRRTLLHKLDALGLPRPRKK